MTAITRRPIIDGSSNTDQYVWQLRSMYQRFRFWNPSIALQYDPAIYEKMLEDPVVRQALVARQGRASGDSWRVDPPRNATDDEIVLAKLVEHGLTGLRKFQMSRFLLSAAILRGVRFGFVEGCRTYMEFPNVEGLPDDHEWWIPNRIRDIDSRRIRARPAKSGEDPVWEYSEVDRASYLSPTIINTTGSGFGWVPLDTRKVIRAAYDDDEGRIFYGRGLAESLYNIVYARSVVLTEGLSGVEKWGQGVIVGHVDKSQLNNSEQTTDDVVDNMLDTLDRMRARNAVVVDKEDDVTVLWPDGAGSSMVIDFLTYLDNLITRLIDGALLPSGGGDASVGSLARGVVEEETIQKLASQDRRMLEDALTEGLIENTFMAFNQETIVTLGLDRCRCPKMILQSDARPDPTMMIDVYTRALGAGVPISADDFYEKTGIRKPEDGDEIIQPIVMTQDGTGAPFRGS